MKTIPLEEMQAVELSLLIELDKVCVKHGLQYYMDGGTLLGAMCYKGFIPWDDDIDLKMPRPDYERLLTLQDEFPDHIKMDAPSKEHCEYTMLKLIDDRTVLIEKSENSIKTTGVYVDIFPMDGHPADHSEWDQHIRRLGRLNSLFHMSLQHFQSMKQSESLISRWKGHLYDIWYTPWKLYQKLTKAAKRYNYETAFAVGLLVEGDPVKERFEKSWLEPGFTLEFEGLHFPAPSGYRRHMEIFYGEHVTRPESYLNLPRYPSQHEHEVYWKDGYEISRDRLS